MEENKTTKNVKEKYILSKNKYTIKGINEVEYQLIDVLKLICAILIIAIHCEIASSEENNVQWYVLHVIFRVAVPFFFIVSGFLFGKKYMKDRKKLKENSIMQIKRLLIPFVFWAFVTILYVIASNPIMLQQNILILLLKLVRLTLFNGWHLWFVLALIVAIGMEYIFLKKNKMKLAIILSIVLYMIALLGNSYYFLIEGTPIQGLMDKLLSAFLRVRNGIFIGFPLFTLGICVAFQENKIEKLKRKRLYLALLIFTITQVIEATFIRGKHYIDDHSVFISSVFMATVLLMLCIRYKNLKLKINTVILRNLSTGIYYIHYPLMGYISILFPFITSWEKFGVTVIGGILLITVLLKWNNKYINLLIK